MWGMKPGSLALLATVAIVVLAAFVVSQSGQAQSGASNRAHRLVGAWSVEVNAEILGAFPALLSFTSDGILLTEDPPVPFETTGHGNWVATGPNEAAFTFLLLVGSEAGPLSATWKIIGKLQFDRQTDNWSGPVKILGFDPDGNEFFADRGTFRGTRIAIETLD